MYLEASDVREQLVGLASVLYGCRQRQQDRFLISLIQFSLPGAQSTLVDTELKIDLVDGFSARRYSGLRSCQFLPLLLNPRLNQIYLRLELYRSISDGLLLRRTLNAHVCVDPLLECLFQISLHAVRVVNLDAGLAQVVASAQATDLRLLVAAEAALGRFSSTTLLHERSRL